MLIRSGLLELYRELGKSSAGQSRTRPRSPAERDMALSPG